MPLITPKYAFRRANKFPSQKEWNQGNVNVLLKVKEILKNKKWFLIGGTLLGAVREKKLLDHRYCLNIAAIDKDDSIFYLLEKIGFRIYKNKVKYGFVKAITRNDAYIDVHVFKEVSDGVIVQRMDPALKPSCIYYAKLPKKFFDELSVVILDGQEFPAPNHPEEFLTLTYGDWKEVDKRHCAHQAFKDYIIK